MRAALFTVDAPPPTRADPARCADRFSSNALPLFEAAIAYVSDNRDDMPIRSAVRMLFASSEPFPELEGYNVATAIEEVLVDAGVLADERLVEIEQYDVSSGLKGYSVRIEPIV